MNLTKNNAKAAVEIIKVLEENKCTVDDAWGILRYVDAKVRSTTTVQRLDYDALLNELTADLDD